jgi:hypothetical protein
MLCDRSFVSRRLGCVPGKRVPSVATPGIGSWYSGPICRDTGGTALVDGSHASRRRGYSAGKRVPHVAMPGVATLFNGSFVSRRHRGKFVIYQEYYHNTVLISNIYIW